MSYLPDFWFAWGRHKDLLREADREWWAGRLRSMQKAGERETPTDNASTGASVRTDVRLGLVEDAPRVAELLELRGIPCWVAFEERFILVERGRRVVGVLRFRRDLGRLHLGLLITDPRFDEGPLVAHLYAGARTVARELGVREIRARTRRHGVHLARAGYREGRGGWRLNVEPG